MTPTTVMFRGQTKVLPSEQDAYIWLVEKFLRNKPDLFTAPESAKYVCKGRQGADYFATSDVRMHQPTRLANGWYAELCLSNNGKVSILDNLAQYAGVKRGTDWEWQAHNRLTKEYIDTDAALAELERMAIAPERATEE